MRTMTQDEIGRALDDVTKGSTVTLAYDSPRGERRFSIPVIGVKRDDDGNVVRVNLERGTAAWMFVQRAKLGGEPCWCFFQPNPYPIYELMVDES